MKFKDFMYEAKKKPEDNWHQQDREYSRISDMKAYLVQNVNERMRYQLFVPKRRDPEEMRRAETRRRVWSAYKDIENSTVKEEAPPVLTSYKESPPGNNKPDSGFWTSSAIQTDYGYTSDWYKYVLDTFKTWQTDYGYLFKVVGQPRLFDVSHAEQFYEWALDHGRIKRAPTEYFKAYTREHMRYAFPWDELSKHFDGVHYDGWSRGSSDITYGWDVESTVWFDTSFLKYVGAVKLTEYNE